MKLVLYMVCVVGLFVAGRAWGTPVRVNDPLQDTGDWSGFTQNETSVAWWNDVALCMYNDSSSGSDFTGNNSGIGWSISSNANTATPTWTDKGALLPPTPSVGGNRYCNGAPVVRAARRTTFYVCARGTDYRNWDNFTTILLFRSTNVGSVSHFVMPQYHIRKDINI